METKKYDDILYIVVPCYNEEEAVPLFYEAFLKETKGMPAEFEFIFVDDGSRDKTWDIIKELSEDCSQTNANYSKTYVRCSR